MKVYRLEDSEGYGPYTTRISRLNDWGNQPYWYEDMMKAHNNEWSHPNGYQDNLDFCSSHRFAFIDLEYLEEWFSGYLHNLLDYFDLVCYTIEDELVEVGRSGKQCIFIPNNSREVIVYVSY